MKDDVAAAAGPVTLLTKTSRRSWELVTRSVSALFRRNNNIYKLFFSLYKKLKKHLSLSTAVLIVHSVRDNTLKVIAVKNSKHAPEGISLTLPDQDSLLHSVFRDGHPYIENNPDNFSGNFIERKLLLGEPSKSLAVFPIHNNGSRIGLICLVSTQAQAFDIIDQPLLNPLSSQFGQFLAKATADLNI
ncbi:MAG: GAF domain-containing protein [bacterium]|jgi:GAF domain-containing protein